MKVCQIVPLGRFPTVSLKFDATFSIRSDTCRIVRAIIEHLRGVRRIGQTMFFPHMMYAARLPLDRSGEALGDRLGGTWDLPMPKGAGDHKKKYTPH